MNLFKLLSFFVLFISTAQAQVSAPYASGQSGDLKWEVRFNHLSSTAGPGSVCDHTQKGKKKGVWCESTDSRNARKLSGIEDRLIEIMNLPEIKSVTLAYLSFSNTAMQNALCDAAVQKNLKVTIYVDSDTYDNGPIDTLRNCASEINIRSVGVGPFGTPGAHLHHIKTFLASTLENIEPLAELSNPTQAVRIGKTYIVSSSANMSSFGTGLHFDNWLFFETPYESNLAQSNVCMFQALSKTTPNQDSRRQFAIDYKSCRSQIRTKERSDLKFYVVPHANMNPKPYDAFLSMVKGAKKEVLVAIHRLTTAAMWRPLVEAKNRKTSTGSRVFVGVVFDDDTLRTGKVNGGASHDVGNDDIKSDRALRDAGVSTYYIETNADTTTHLHHNKFVVVDNSILFQGAGNFTGSSLNIYGLGNYEQFYVTQIPELVDAYRRAWQDLKSLGTRYQDHEVAGNQDKPISAN